MGKLFNLKEWLTVADSARHLTIVFGEDVTEADVLRLALEEKLPISVYFPRPTYARQLIEETYTGFESVGGEILLASDVLPRTDEYIYKTHTNICGEPFVVTYREIPENSTAYVATDSVVKVLGLWNIYMNFGQRAEIDRQYQKLIGANVLPPDNESNLYISNLSGDLFELVISYEESKYFDKKEFAKNPVAYGKHYLPLEELPSDSYFVIRTDSLRDFEASINGTSTSPEKPLSPNERNSLLTIIAALCDCSAIKYQDRGAAAKIVKITEEFGAPVSHDTVTRALSKIPDALDSRMK
jgi:hypothetical protein